jgi:hypothetical protein
MGFKGDCGLHKKVVAFGKTDKSITNGRESTNSRSELSQLKNIERKCEVAHLPFNKILEGQSSSYKQLKSYGGVIEAL